MLQLAGFSQIKEVGAGGQAKVFSAMQDAFQRKAAIKVLHPELAEDQDFASRFLREAQIVAGLSHPNIVQVFGSGQIDGHLYMAMEFLGSGDLTQAIEKGMDLNRALDVTSQVAMALHFLHHKGFVHRDVKPDNVLFRDDGTAVLTDFGIARAQNAAHQLTMVGQVLGTPKYMSPEQLQDKAVDGRSDIYSLGIMFYQMLTKKVPYDDKDFTALAMKHLQAPIPKLPAEFAQYQKLFERMVAKEPDKRFQDALEIARLIKQIRSGKLDASKVESGAAAALKRTAGQGAKPAAGIAAAHNKRVFIPREWMVVLQDMDPLLDRRWKEKVTLIYNKMGQEQREYVFAQYLEPKGIQMDADGKEFVFYGRKSVQDINSSFITSSQLQVIANKLEKAEQMLKTTDDVLAFVDMMEGSLSLIERFDSQENLRAQKEKNALRSAFLDDLVLIVRSAKFKVPETQRKLTEEAIKTYIIEVYLKQQMMGYRFRTVPLATLETSKKPFLATVVVTEARTRQCDVVKSDRYIFLIGPVKSAQQNPYSVRRFVQEDSTMNGQLVYFNVAVIDMAKIDDAAMQEHWRWVFTRIVTLERQLSIGVINLVKEIEATYKEKLNPMLLKPIEADGTDIEQIIEERLGEYEKQLSMMVLGRMPKGVKELAESIDDYEFLFFSIRRLVIEMACDVRDFAAQSTTVWSERAEKLDMRMMSYLKLLDKRKDSVFVKRDPNEELDPSMDTTLPKQEFINILDDFEPKIEALRTRLKEVIRKKEQPKGVFRQWLDKTLGLEKKKVTPEDVQNEINSIRHKCLIALIKARKRYPVITVYLEFEDLVEVDEAVRHYALPAGTDGLARLPILLELPEKKADIEIAKIREALELDAFKVPNKWVGSVK